MRLTPKNVLVWDKAGAGLGNNWANTYELIAYLIHPVGVALDTLIARPGHWLVHREPLKTLFGHKD